MTSIVGTGLEGYIKRNARERALNRIAEAEIEARRLTERAERRAAVIREEAAAAVEIATQSTHQRTLAQAEIEAQGLSLRRREAMLQRIWQQAREQLGGLTPVERRAALVALIMDAAEQLGGGELLLQANATDAALLTPTVLDELTARVRPLGVTRLTLSSEPAAILGGVIVRAQAAPGAAQHLVDNSWDERLRLAYDAIRDDIYTMLAAPENGQPQDRGALS